MILPVRNATLLKIASGGTSEDWDQPGGADTVKWEGSSDAHLIEETVTDVSPGPDRSGTESGASLDELVVTRLAIDAALATVVLGDSITYKHQGVTHTREVRNVQRPDPLGVVRVTLKDA